MERRGVKATRETARPRGCRVGASPPVAAEHQQGELMKLLFVVTSHDQLGDSGVQTGLWYEELAAPYYVFTDAGHQVTIASPKGGKPPVDPRSTNPPFDAPVCHRFDADATAQAALADTAVLASVAAEDFDAIFYPGGHGPMFDVVEDKSSIALIEAFYAAGKYVASVCHGPGSLRRTQTPDGQPLVAGRHVTGFTNAEEVDSKALDDVPFLIEDEFVRLGGIFEKVANWQPHVVIDGQLITGQNPGSAQGVAEALLAQLTQ
ncbi:type 1 glutamine amidotransferase domain-containing protein [Mycobacterium sp. E1319]|uniref:type 1 glutamine amidotransferase domain-containing protein n=2 Tax=unclassified Mycobacterium TaxID=2642494 RepID=UPI001E423740|nr:type 1 glutamine amidotransferase domain-containing protein [Mycobacterium sp. E1319]